jgi:hypothetical protein
MLREIERVLERLPGGTALDNRREVQDREGNHSMIDYGAPSKGAMACA